MPSSSSHLSAYFLSCLLASFSLFRSVNGILLVQLQHLHLLLDALHGDVWVVVFSRFSPGRKVCRRGERETPATLTTETRRAQGRGREEEEDRGKFAESECCRGGWKVRVEKALWYLNLTSGFETAPIPSHSPFQPLTYSATPHRGYSCCAPWNSPLRSFRG